MFETIGFTLMVILLIFRKHIVYWTMERDAKKEGRDPSLIRMLKELDINEDEDKAGEHLHHYVKTKAEEIIKREGLTKLQS